MNRCMPLVAPAAAVLACGPLAAAAQTWPTRPITYIMPFTPGGATGEIGRTVAQQLNAESVKALKTPDVRDKVTAQMGMEVVGSSPRELTAPMQRELPRWAALVKKSGASPN